MNTWIGIGVIVILFSFLYLNQIEKFDQKKEVINQLNQVMDVSKALLRRRI